MRRRGDLLSDDEIDETEINVNSMVLDPFEYESKTKFSIRDESKFTEHFMKIFDKVRSKSLQNNDKDSSLSINSYKFDAFIEDILLKRFLPYCFLWASLVLRDPYYIMDRWTNGYVEGYIKKRKEEVIPKGRSTGISPAEYLRIRSSPAEIRSTYFFEF